jgi:hypothetical protein
MGPIGQQLPGFIAHFAAPLLNFDLFPKEKIHQGDGTAISLVKKQKNYPSFAGIK